MLIFNRYNFDRITNIPVKDFFKNSPILIFHHIPKCGGTSLLSVLNRWFVLRKDYEIARNYQQYASGELTFEETEKSEPFDLGKFRSFECLAGHWSRPSIYLSERYPEVLNSTRFRIFTFLRDPLEVKVSLYFYEKKLGKLKREGLDLFLLHSRPNYIASIFPCNQDNYQQVLSRYFFVGIVERYQESLEFLAALLHRKPYMAPHVNQSKKHDIDIDPELYQKFREINRLDYMIYDYSLGKFNNTIKRV